MRFLALQLKDIIGGSFDEVWDNKDITDYYKFSVDLHFKNYCQWMYWQRKKK